MTYKESLESNMGLKYITNLMDFEQYKLNNSNYSKEVELLNNELYTSTLDNERKKYRKFTIMKRLNKGVFITISFRGNVMRVVLTQNKFEGMTRTLYINDFCNWVNNKDLVCAVNLFINMCEKQKRRMCN